MLESIAIITLFYIIRLIWDCHKDTQRTREINGSPEECRQAEDLAVSMRNKMEAKGLKKYILNDFRFSEQLMPEDLKSETILQQKMTRMMRELHAYLHLAPGYQLSVRFDRDNSMDRSGQCDYGNRRIDIFPRSHYTADTLIAILAHESAHYFMYQYGLTDPDKDLNERCTDTVACLMGLSAYMVNGSIGYLKHGQFVAIRNNLLAYRNTRASSQNQQSTPAGHQSSAEQLQEQKRLRSSLNAANALLQQTKSVVRVKKIPSRTDLTPQDYHRLNRLVDALNNGNYDRTLAFCNKLLQGNLTNLRTGQQDVMRVCNDLNAVMQMFA